MRSLKPAGGGVPLPVIDVWQHAYDLDSQEKRAEHAKVVLNTRVHWGFAADNLPGLMPHWPTTTAQRSGDGSASFVAAAVLSALMHALSSTAASA